MEKLDYSEVCMVLGRLYLESQLEINRLNLDNSKLKLERDQALNLLKGNDNFSTGKSN